jgi:hypothetical protein
MADKILAITLRLDDPDELLEAMEECVVMRFNHSLVHSLKPLDPANGMKLSNHKMC